MVKPKTLLKRDNNLFFMNFEVEVRSFISKEKYEKLLEFFKKKGEFISRDYQETYYFDCENDLRIQRNNFFSKIWLKKGKIHDDYREEIEIRFDKDEFERLEGLFLALGFNVEIKWFRRRNVFKWEDVDVMIDYTKGYGYIIELEKKSTEEEKEKILKLLKQKLKSLGIPLTPKEKFNEKFEDYKKNWKKLVNP